MSLGNSVSDTSRLQKLQDRLKHLDLGGRISNLRPVNLSRNAGSTCDILCGDLAAPSSRNGGEGTVKIAVKRLRFYLYEDGKFDRVSLPRVFVYVARVIDDDRITVRNR